MFFSTLQRLSSRTFPAATKACFVRQSHFARCASTLAKIDKLNTLESIGIPGSLARSVREVYPHIHTPYIYQANLVSAFIRQANISFKGKTGTGKSFSLALASLAQAWQQPPERSRASTLILVPHRDLAAQYYSWMSAIVTAAQPFHDNQDTSSLPLTEKQIFLLARGYSENTLSAFKGENYARIVISTPQTLIGELGGSLTPESVAGLFTTVVVDELDDQLDYVPGTQSSKTLSRLVKTKMKRHPRPAKELLDALFAANRLTEGANPLKVKETSTVPPQLVLASATYRDGLVDFVQKQRYLDPSRGLVRVKVHADEVDLHNTVVESKAEHARRQKKQARVLHHALIVTSDGEVYNHEKASKHPKLADALGSQPRKQQTTEDTSEVTQQDHDQPTAEVIFAKAEEDIDTVPEDDMPPELIKKFSETESPFNQRAMEVVAEVFAHEVKLRSLLILPSEAPVRRAIWELRQLGVNARAMNVKDEPDLLRSNSKVEKPTLLIATDATTRGLDIWNLTHVFIYGAPDGLLSADKYVHWAGRVGRVAGRDQGSDPSRVITIVTERPKPGVSDPQSHPQGPVPRTTKDEVGALQRIFDKLHLTVHVYPPYQRFPLAARKPKSLNKTKASLGLASHLSRSSEGTQP